jgi:ABC-type Mn2+/Zn2+ transport system ATPase subunit
MILAVRSRNEGRTGQGNQHCSRESPGCWRRRRALERTVEVRDIADLPQVNEIDRWLPIDVYELVAMGRGDASAHSARSARSNASGFTQRLRRVELTGFESLRQG